ncbi:Extracytoplasmic solute receptor protein yiaO [uncultured Clostridium sp.]|nr:Extracytoplasmic solute receptor protein yiaO [uncultured Clostridium sp.]
MKKARKILSSLLATTLLFSLSACGNGSSSTPVSDPSVSGKGGGQEAGFPSMTIQIAHVNPTTDDDQYHKFATLFAEKVRAATDGAVTFEICGNSELGAEGDVITGMGLGTHQMSVMSNLAYAAVNGPSKVSEMPFMFADSKQAAAFFDSDIMKEVTDGMYDSLGVKVLGWAEGGFRNILSQKPIRTPDDIKGMKIRVPESDTFMKTFEALGANPTPMAFSEVFTAVQQKTIDGLELPVASAYTGSYYEVCSHYNLTGHFYNGLAMSISTKLWETLSPELQEIFVEAAVEAGTEQRKWLAGKEQEMKDAMAEAGCTIVDDVDVVALRDAAANVYDFYRNEIGADLQDRAMAFINS